MPLGTAERRTRMKHYICVEEHGITYICGTYKAPGRAGGRGTIVVQEAQSYSSGRSPEGVLAEWAAQYGLEGKRIVLVMGRRLSFLYTKLPKAGKRALRRMAYNELMASKRCGADCLSAVDIQKISGEPHIGATVYYMERGQLEPYVKAMERAGMIYGGTLLMPDCTAVASRMMCRRRSSLIIDVEKEGIGLYAVAGGHCLSWVSSPLKAGYFCGKGAKEVLYDEIAEQAARIRQQLEDDKRMFSPEYAVLVGNCFSDMEDAAACLKERLDMPCEGAAVSVSGKDVAVTPGALAAVAAGSLSGKSLFGKSLSGVSLSGVSLSGKGPVRLSSGPDGEDSGMLSGIYGIVSGRNMLFLLANLILAAGISGYVGFQRAQVTGELKRLRSVMSDAGFREQYRASCKLENEVSAMAARMAAEESLRSASSGFLDRTDFEAFASAMEADMDVEAVAYEKEPGTMEMTISQNSPEQVPGLVERIRDSGVFHSVSHSDWEQEEDNGTVRIHTSVRAVLKEGEQDENK